ncbi:hypothetical protein [Geitlerinema sp. PCC 9228]|jgi:hypothetical protein|nr:hypothetical protein [Geitlerinema sp. PCC 9228]
MEELPFPINRMLASAGDRYHCIYCLKIPNTHPDFGELLPIE